MPDIDPAALSRSDSAFDAFPTPSIPAKALNSAPPASQKAGKAVAGAPRIDTEPIYTALKAALKEQWTSYKTILGLFMLGQRNQAELSRQIEYIFARRKDPSLERLHNQLVTAIYGNAVRDPPEQGVASWVSANDKPTVVAKPAGGDGNELRLKTEIRALSKRDRKRLKAIQDEPVDTYTRTLQEYYSARHIHLPDFAPTSAGGVNKTNWELEIRKRYAQALFSETLELPNPDTIASRLTPICYEEGLRDGASQGCADFITVAAETFLKEALANIYTKTRSNICFGSNGPGRGALGTGGGGGGFVVTARYRRRLEKEEELWSRGQLQKNAAGLLPVEVEMMGRNSPLTLEDLRLSLELGDRWLGQTPLVAAKVKSGAFYELKQEEEEEEEEVDQGGPALAERALPNGVPLVNGVKDEASMDENDWGWQGAGAADREALHSLLDDCLAIGQ